MPAETIELTGEAIYGIDHEATRSNRMMMETNRTVRLGRKPPRPGKRSLRMGDYFDSGAMLMPPPASVDYASAAKDAISRMYVNDTLGCCVIASSAHAHGVWTGNESRLAAQATDAEIRSTYQSWCGPGDNGCVIGDVLDRMKSEGLPMGGVRHFIDGYASVDWTNQLQTKVSLFLLGVIKLGINLPQAWTSAAVWDITNTPIVGGHDVAAVGYSFQGVTVASWGRLYLITWAAFMSRRWLEESYAMLAPDWWGGDKLAPCGFDATTLQRDVAIIAGGGVPPIDPVVPPTPTPPIPIPPTPAPTPVPVSFPDYVGTAVGVIPGVLGSKPVTLQITLKPKAAAGFQTSLSVASWFALFRDGLALVSAISSADFNGVVAAVEKTLADLGVSLPLEHRHAIAAKLLSGVDWMAAMRDGLALAAAALSKDVPGAVAAASKLLADLGIYLPGV